MLTCPTPMSRRRWRAWSDSRGRAGGAAFAGLLWLVAAALMVLPFLRTPEEPNWAGDGVGRSEKDPAFAAAVAAFDAESGLGFAAHVSKASEEWFGEGSQRLAASGLVERPRIAPGRELYATECAGCHGSNGDGGGPSAKLLAPRPRNFRKGVFKFTSVEPSGRPLRRDLLRTITQGLAGSSMPEFRLVSEERRKDVAEYVRWISLRGEFEELMLASAIEEEELPDPQEIAEIIAERWDEPGQRILRPSSPETSDDDASVARGRALFLDTARANCAACHGQGGLGDGPTASDYLDDWGYPIRPRDLTSGVYRAGQESADLWTVIAGGVKGTPMAAFGGTLTSDEIWDLVHFVQSLAIDREAPNPEAR